MGLRQTLFVLLGLWWGTAYYAPAAPCRRLTGVVEDQATHQPLDAQFYVKTPNGRVSLGSSAAGSGRFSLDVPCPASVLFIDRAGYQPQQLRLNSSSAPGVLETIALIIPLTAVDPLDINKPYLQSQQTHYEQTRSATPDRPQHRHAFVITDALSGQAVAAHVCFFLTSSGRKTCLNTGAGGQISLPFPEKDIVALEVTAADYQPYQGNLILENPAESRLRHTLRLTRTLTVLSVRLGAPGDADLQPADSSAPILLRPVAGQRTITLVGQAPPGTYALRVYDRNRTIRDRRTVQLQTGLNHVALDNPPTPNDLSITDFTSDSLPTLYFDQGSYTLRPDVKTMLLRAVNHLKQHPTLRIQLVGHADPEGDARLNEALAQNRVKVTATFLGAQGIPERQIESVSHGSWQPVAPSDTEENKVKNRRVQMRFIP